MAQTEREKLASIFRETTVPAGLEQRVLLAVKTAQRREEIFSRRFWTIGLTSSIVAVLLGLASSWQAFSANGILEIAQTAFSNINVVRPTDLVWGLLENLPINSLTLTFIATTALGWLASLGKQERQHLLHLKFI